MLHIMEINHIFPSLLLIQHLFKQKHQIYQCFCRSLRHVHTLKHLRTGQWETILFQILYLFFDLISQLLYQFSAIRIHSLILLGRQSVKPHGIKG